MLGITQHEKNFQQECSPVGCVPPVHYRTVAVGGGGFLSKGSLSRVAPCPEGISVRGGGALCSGGSLSRGVSIEGGLPDRDQPL